MKNLMLAVLLLLSGCSTTPIDVVQTSGTKIVFLRDSGLFGSGCKFSIRIDGSLVGTLSQGESLIIPTSEGEHQISAGTGTYSEGVFTKVCVNVIQHAVVEIKDKPVVFRIGISANGQMFFERMM